MLVVALTTSALAGCATAPKEDLNKVVAGSIPPSKVVRIAITEVARTQLYDPYSIRDAGISNIGTFSTGLQGVCVRGNSKNRLGGYTGRENFGVVLKGSQVVQTYLNHPYCLHPGLKWHRFPELEALKNL